MLQLNSSFAQEKILIYNLLTFSWAPIAKWKFKLYIVSMLTGTIFFNSVLGITNEELRISRVLRIETSYRFYSGNCEGVDMRCVHS